jgi:arabinose-5-phosphate isomerase
MSLTKQLLERQKHETECIYQEMDCQKIEELVDLLLKHKETSTIYFTGIGKSFNQAKHTSDLLKSIGFKSHTLHPIDSLHGDLGTLSSGDIIFLYSKSGKTKELIELIFFLKQMPVHLIGVFCQPNSKLEKDCHQTLILPCGKELDYNFDLVPTTSVISYLVFCNLMVATLMNKMNIQLETYGTHHPAGAIGQKIWLRVEDIMYHIDDVCRITGDKTLLETMIEMSSKHVGYCLIVNPDNNSLLEGIVSDGDIRRFLTANNETNFKEIQIRTLENKNPKTINAKTKVADLGNWVDKERKKLNVGLPVINDKNHLVGFIDNKKLVGYLQLL